MVSIKHRYTGVEYKKVTGFSVKFKDVFDLDQFYILLYEWLVEKGYVTRADETFPEKYYMDRTGAAGKEVWFRWRPKRHPVSGNKFWRFDLDIDVHVLGLKDVELVVQNKKIKAHKGEVEVMVSANMIFDASGEWRKDSFLKPFRSFYFKRFLSKKKDFLEKEFYNEAFEFRDAVNAYLKLETYLPSKLAGMEFWPKRTPE